MLEISYNFLNNDLTQVVGCPIQTPDCDNPALLKLFISFDPSIFSTVAFPPLENFDHAVVSVSVEFLNDLPDDIVCVIFLSILMILLSTLKREQVSDLWQQLDLVSFLEELSLFYWAV